ncbi:ATP-binding protein [Xanthobacteraceae bacterium Astr-EGSB]|uniref:AAA family ATPase n=1 Tax=Astrobacterium formosum TaxID=3069710 RepID=UPI0027AEEAFD|nr:ATP-binding protein [Xanthobacteraceae bacterium Astr-EGSB]
MAKADHIKKLVASFGRSQEFRAATLRIIDDAATQGKQPFADSLRKILDANVRPDYQASGQPSLTALASQIDPATDLVDEITVSRGLNDIVLNSDTRILIDDIIEERHRSEELRRHRLPISTRLLFSGPPGCGKTLCAEVLARELNLPLYSARIDVIISSFLGETASNLRRLFEFVARRPCVLFLDEFDALARTRADAAEHNELRRVVNSLLLMIERFKGPGLVIAATNLPQFLDEALWRRFDDILSFDPPTEREITLLLSRQFANFPAHFDLATPVSKLVGMSYADIERICIDAIKKAVLKKRKSVSETEFAAALRQETRRKGLSSRRNA